MHDAIQWIAVLGMVGIAVVFVFELRKWRSIGRIMTRGQRILRVMLILCVEALFVMMLVGPHVTSRKDPVGSLLYWTICLILGIVVAALALLDLKTILGQYSQLNRQLLEQLKEDDRRDK
ncbi:MAG: hypothetical protein GX139_04860 [Armatimonadetes bacterium]|jgi:hypothetical protein|nr:hypothetical protein [Armatimonadota bacterium]